MSGVRERAQNNLFEKFPLVQAADPEEAATTQMMCLQRLNDMASSESSSSAASLLAGSLVTMWPSPCGVWMTSQPKQSHAYYMLKFDGICACMLPNFKTSLPNFRPAGCHVLNGRKRMRPIWHS